jgi:hypothetical protein
METLAAAAARGEDPIGLCVVVDARSGRVLSTWRGHAARSHPDGTAPAVAARAAQGHRNRIILLRDARGPSREPPVPQDRQIGSWRTAAHFGSGRQTLHRDTHGSTGLALRSRGHRSGHRDERLLV